MSLAEVKINSTENASGRWLKPHFFTENIIGMGLISSKETANPLLTGNILIDPGTNLENLLISLQEAGTSLGQIKYIVLTHLHFDHFGSVPGLLIKMAEQGLTAPIIIAPKGSTELMEHADLEKLGLHYYPGSVFTPFKIDQELKDGDEFIDGKIKLKAISTPGHHPFHNSYLIEDITSCYKVLASGDAISGLIDDLTGSDVYEFVQSLVKLSLVESDGIYESHGHPAHLLSLAKFKSRMKSIICGEIVLIDGPFLKTKIFA